MLCVWIENMPHQPKSTKIKNVYKCNVLCWELSPRHWTWHSPICVILLRSWNACMATNNFGHEQSCKLLQGNHGSFPVTNCCFIILSSCSQELSGQFVWTWLSEVWDSQLAQIPFRMFSSILVVLNGNHGYLALQHTKIWSGPPPLILAIVTRPDRGCDNV